MKPRSVIVTIEADSDLPLKELKQFVVDFITDNQKVLQVRQVGVQVVQVAKADKALAQAWKQSHDKREQRVG